MARRRFPTGLKAPTLLLALLTAGSALADPRPVTMLPPKRPALLGLDVETTGSVVASNKFAQDDTQTAPMPIAGAAAPGTPKAPLGEREIIGRANALLNSITTLVADFTQIGGDNRRLNGTLYLARPGKLRFEYDKPSTMEVVSDGSTVLVRDRKLNTSDPYPISQTPLKFLLSNKIDLGRDVNLKSVQTDPDGVRVTIEDSTTLGGTSKITLSFDPGFTALMRWRVVDPQGYTTTVALTNQERNTVIDPKVFMLNYSRPVD
jgi:outer membrane lipoprotein-sorting protein